MWDFLLKLHEHAGPGTFFFLLIVLGGIGSLIAVLARCVVILVRGYPENPEALHGIDED